MTSALGRFLTPTTAATVATVATDGASIAEPCASVGLSSDDRALAIALLDKIDETDPDERSAYLDRLSKHPEWIADMRRMAYKLGLEDQR